MKCLIYTLFSGVGFCNQLFSLETAIYLHKVKQPVKYKGRADFTPSKDECFEIDCNAGGLMMFSGTDHVHFREELPDDFYHIVLLHYCSV